MQALSSFKCGNGSRCKNSHPRAAHSGDRHVGQQRQACIMFVRLAGAAAASAGRACTLSFSCVSRMVLPSAFFLQLCPSRLRRALLASAARTFKPAWCASSRRSDSRSACTSFTGALATPASPSGGESSKRVAEGSHVPEESGHLPVEEIQSSTCKWRQHPFKRYVSGLQLGGLALWWIDTRHANTLPHPGGRWASPGLA